MQALSLECVITRETQSSQGVAHMVWLILCMPALRFGGTSISSIFKKQAVFTLNVHRNTIMHIHTQALPVTKGRAIFNILIFTAQYDCVYVLLFCHDNHYKYESELHLCV